MDEEEDWDHELGVDRQENERILKEEWFRTVVDRITFQKSSSSSTRVVLNQALPSVSLIHDSNVEDVYIADSSDDYLACMKLLGYFKKKKLDFDTSKNMNVLSSSSSSYSNYSELLFKSFAYPRYYKQLKSYITSLVDEQQQSQSHHPLVSSSSLLDPSFLITCLIYLGELYLLDGMMDCGVACYALAESFYDEHYYCHLSIAEKCVFQRIYDDHPHSLKRYLTTINDPLV